ncbi:MAG TPA: hypothetical protein IGS52_22470 [Oscillatoriaceae cyanobacterium M33_DOE_052]|uniref:histidine kinase n=1 Tax=Planktothricoides sp. SpSt-374 TaxID=2282167 RepID=A0A7C3ZNB1_9CYAN|nr:hypothetical protein [Oscillatoriaceae cyanobacterium M33_DOE_052]
MEAANQALAVEITERKKAEEDVRNLNAVLELRVQERTQELAVANADLLAEIADRKRAQARLQAYTKKLEQSNRELQDFAFVASHDLQEPLRKIQAFGDRLQARFGDKLGDQGQDFLGRMQNAASRMQVLIEDLLSFSRVTTKAQPFAPVNLSKVVEGVLSDLETRIERTQGRVTVGELPTIDADSSQMRQLFQNLIGNALKFHRAGVPPEIEVSAHLNNHGICEIRVADNGIGFEQKHVERIFTVFQRLHSRSEYEGTGIGLAICRKIVERHNGIITATSTLGKGSTFIVTLPVTHPEGASIQ